LTVQALGGGSPELRPLEAARAAGATAVGADGPVRVPIEDALDLHTFAPQDVPSVVAEYLAAALARGFAEVRLIHGRGQGVQRTIVRSLLAKHPLVAGYTDAPPGRGGWGATIVRLRHRQGVDG
jgi:DNA-nicking Smr family endonuclease